jgi:hypothetical protein
MEWNISRCLLPTSKRSGDLGHRSISPLLAQVHGDTLSIAEISSPSLFDSSLATGVTSVTPITAITFSLDSNTSGNSRDTPRQKAQTPEDDSGAKTDLDGFDPDLKVQAAPTLSSDLGNDLTCCSKT